MSNTVTLREPKTFPARLAAFCKRNLFVWLAFLVPLALMLTAYHAEAQQIRETILLDKGWKFALGNASDPKR